MGVGAPKRVIKLGENLSSCGSGEVVFPGARHGLQGEAETREGIRLAIARVGVHGTQEPRGKERGEAAHGGRR